MGDHSNSAVKSGAWLQLQATRKPVHSNLSKYFKKYKKTNNRVPSHNPKWSTWLEASPKHSGSGTGCLIVWSRLRVLSNCPEVSRQVDQFKDVPEADDPGFFESVEYFFHKACVLAEDTLIDVNMKPLRISREEKEKKCHGILRIIEPCAHVLEV